MTLPARRLALAELAEAPPVEIAFAIDAAQMQAFAALSGDFNPLHTDAAFARAKGLAGPVVYGGLLLAQVSRLLGMHLPGRDGMWTGIRMDFRSPLMVGEEAVLMGHVAEVSESVGLATLKVEIRAGGRLIAKGTADSVVREAG
jgi:3-hydroxybutyryl-CoA dehydratase